MKKSNLWLGILAITLVFGMTAVGCDKDSADELDGTTWTNSPPGSGVVYTFTFNSPNFKWTVTGSAPIATGTYSISGNKVTMKRKDGAADIEATISGNTLTCFNATYTKK